MKIQIIQDCIDKIRGKRRRRDIVKGKPLPHNEKMEIVKNCFIQAKCCDFIETGTFQGDTTDVLKNIAEKVYTIELSPEYHSRAVSRFKDFNNVECLLGDSTSMLPIVLQRLKGKPLFWLDGHYSGGDTAQGEKDSPINEELQSIFDAGIKEAVILIDDARCFGYSKDYPSLDELKNKILTLWPLASFENKDDIIRVNVV
jgi:hypothetical protein